MNSVIGQIREDAVFGYKIIIGLWGAWWLGVLVESSSAMSGIIMVFIGLALVAIAAFAVESKIGIASFLLFLNLLLAIVSFPVVIMFVFLGGVQPIIFAIALGAIVIISAIILFIARKPFLGSLYIISPIAGILLGIWVGFINA